MQKILGTDGKSVITINKITLLYLRIRMTRWCEYYPNLFNPILTAFYAFPSRGWGRGVFLTHFLENKVRITLIDLKFCTDIKLLRTQQFKRVACFFRDMTSQTLSLHIERFITFQYLHPEIGFNNIKINFLWSKTIFLTQNYTPLHISVIFN